MPRAFATSGLLFFMVASASAQNDVMTPQHVAKMRIVTEAVIAPDGGHVAYILSVPRDLPKEKDGGSWTELHVVDTKGNSTPFITGAVNVSNIAWTPDGKSIAFLSKRDKDDTKSLYAEAVQAIGPQPSSNQINRWFWNQTLAGAFLRALRTAAMTSPHSGFNTAGSRFIVPGPWINPA